MTLKKHIYSILSIATLAVCSSFVSSTLGDGTFSKNGVSFKIPSNWKIGEKNKIDNGYTVSLAKTDASADMISITWLAGDMPLDTWLELFQSQFKLQEAMKSITFEESVKGKYNNIACLKSNFKVSILTLPFNGTMFALKKANKMVLIYQHETSSDTPVANTAFKAFEKSLVIVQE